MTRYATHRFSVGQQVRRFAEAQTTCEVIGLIDGAEGPKYKITSPDENANTIVAERELTYAPVATSNERRLFSVH